MKFFQSGYPCVADRSRRSGKPPGGLGGLGAHCRWTWASAALVTWYRAFHVLPSSMDQEHVPPPIFP